MNASELKYRTEQANQETFFFDRGTMRFFGDTMRNFGVRSFDAQTWELYRKKPVKNGLQSSAFFRKNDFKRVRPES